MRIHALIAIVLLIPAVAVSAPDPPPAAGSARELPRHLQVKRSEADVTVRLDLQDATPRRALERIFAQTPHEFRIDADVPDTPRITLRLPNVSLYTALDLITQSLGVNWGRVIEEGKIVFGFGKSVIPIREYTHHPLPGTITARGPGLSFHRSMRAEDVLKAHPGLLSQMPTVGPSRIEDTTIYKLTVEQARATFTCPHCQTKATVLPSRKELGCPTCERAFQIDWRFCPFDGAPRPVATGDWRFCPSCGKRVEIAKPAAAKQTEP